MDRAQMEQIWKDVLGREGVQDSDTFFELGGDSISAMTLMFHVEETFGVMAEVFEIFDHPRFGDFVGRMASLMAPA